jgi:hypothetical protein
MAFDPTPTELIAGWSEDGTDVTFPIASIPELTAAEADAVTGDSRKIIYALLEQIAAWFEALPLADQPTQLTISRGVAVETAPGVFTRSYNIQAKITGSSPLDIADEPS